MKMFQSEPAQSEPSNVKKDAPVKEGGWKPPMRPVANESLPSDKKGQKNSNVSDLLSKFGGKARMTSPTSDRNSPSPEGVPILPPKPAGKALACTVTSIHIVTLYCMTTERTLELPNLSFVPPMLEVHLFLKAIYLIFRLVLWFLVDSENCQ